MRNIIRVIRRARFLIARRIIQISIIALFSLQGFWLKGDLSSSLLFEQVSLSDPFAFLQISLSTLYVQTSLLLSALVVFGFYALLGGRVFCGWICPVNIITDFAAFCRDSFGFKGSRLVTISKSLRYYLLILSLVLSLILGWPVFEHLSFVGIIQRGLIFGFSSAIYVGFLLFVFDLFFQKRAICSHICPLGGFYALASKPFAKMSLLHVVYEKDDCDKCMNCKKVCPEEQVLFMLNKHSAPVLGSECLRCGRCVDVCDSDALNFNILKGLK